eukprot:360260-Amphidinium_carterae.1
MAKPVRSADMILQSNQINLDAACLHRTCVPSEPPRSLESMLATQPWAHVLKTDTQKQASRQRGSSG